MLKLSNFNTSVRMLLAASVGLLCLLLISFMGSVGLGTINERAESMYERNMKKLQLANEARSVLQNVVILAPVFTSSLDRVTFTTNLERYQTNFADIMTQYEPLVVDDHERELLQTAKFSCDDYINSIKNIPSARSQAEVAVMSTSILPMERVFPKQNIAALSWTGPLPK